MPSPELAKCLADAAVVAKSGGMTGDVFDIAAFRKAVGETTYALPEGTVTQDIKIGDLACVWVRAPNAHHERRILYLHGGGLVVGGFHSHKGIAAWLSYHSGCSILFPEYRLAPENPYPAAVQDGTRALEWICGHSPEGEHQADGVVIGGDSGGAGLAVATLLKSTANVIGRVRATILLCPMLNWDPESAPSIRNSLFRRQMAAAYVAGADARDGLVSPQFAKWDQIPPVLIQAAHQDEFFPDAKAGFEACLSSRRPVDFDAWPDMPHVWHRFAPVLPEAVEALRRAGEFAKASFSRSF